VALGGVVFDLDGTLVDTNAAHVGAWHDALQSAGFRMPHDRIAPEIGKGGDRLLPSLLGATIARDSGASLRRDAARAFGQTARSTRFNVFPGTVDLLVRLRDLGLQVAVATSASAADLQSVLSSCGLKLDRLVDAIVTSSDAQETKPDPDLVLTALSRIGLGAAQCVVIGDTPHDAEAARRAGVAFAGVTTGYHSEIRLRHAGARCVFRDPADLLSRIDEFLHVCSPVEVELTQAALEQYMRAALVAARAALDEGEVPIGTVVVRGDGEIVARGQERIRGARNMTAHSLINALRELDGERVGFEGAELVVVSTVEPCEMCAAASSEARADTIAWGVSCGPDGGSRRLSAPAEGMALMPRMIGGVLETECRSLLSAWVRRNGDEPTAHHRFVRRLLAGFEQESRERAA